MRDYTIDIEEIDKAEIVGIRTPDFDEFLDTWIVTFDGRMFARSWSRLKNSWFFAFEKQGKGLLKRGTKVYEVMAVVPKDLEEITSDINQAYERRYGQGSMASIAKSMQDASRWDMTMEFKIVKEVK